MFISKHLVLLIIIISHFNGNGQQLLQRNRFRRLNKPSGLKLKQRLQEKLNQYKQRTIQTICYDIVGCFELPHKRSPLQKVPENPEMLGTQFYLFRRGINFSQPEILHYDDDGKSLRKSSFNYSQPLKMIIHGYMGKWNDIGNLIGANTYLKIYDCNMVLMDWSVGARGPQYAMAAANTELVGRQLGILLLKMIENGLKPEDIHLLGFSLGAHVAGSSSEVLKKKGHLIGRITGLDAASPLFRTNHLREKHKKLDRDDARLVDVVHTDASPTITDGFGLWQPIGHVDFFPNGGQEQPGCRDTRQSVVVTHFEQVLTREVACSHIRAWRLFQETLLNKAAGSHNRCEFTAFSCPGGLKSFEKGFCFPHLPKPNSSLAIDLNYRNDIGRFGEDIKGQGVMFFVTRATPPYCGTQLQASVHISPKTEAIKGVLLLDVNYPHHNVSFQIECDADDLITTGTVMSGLGVADYETLTENVKNLTATLKFIDLEYEEENNNTYIPTIYIDKVEIRDMYSNSWQFCQKDTALKDTVGLNPAFSITLSRDSCFA
nr:PREDICTED: pancreatic triacylglycerol lipase [Tribolium castaneum]|eukprot:XP_971822.3 PREDICTED: pancreatic triacylglycerol lipase [Tribolium castaneum]